MLLLLTALLASLFFVFGSNVQLSENWNLDPDYDTMSFRLVYLSQIDSYTLTVS